VSAKIFLVDDDVATLKLFKNALEKAGFEVLASSEAIGTTNRAKEFAPQIVIMDVMMPVLPGNKIVKMLKEKVPDNPFIILYSNKDEDELKKIAEECGADDYITKLNGPAAVVSKVRECIIRRNKLSHPK
jgi:two-component system, OmpR family, alkaline phosphatase synthesis response regulator PhoP